MPKGWPNKERRSNRNPDGLDDRVSNGWIKGGRNGQGHPIPPWTEKDWIAAKQYRV